MKLLRSILVFIFILCACDGKLTVKKSKPESIFGVWVINHETRGWDSKLTLDIRENETIVTNRCRETFITASVPTKVTSKEFVILERAERESARGLFGCKISLAPMSSPYRIVENQLELNLNGEPSRFDFLHGN